MGNFTKTQKLVGLDRCYCLSHTKMKMDDIEMEKP
jgi:hypothetical protein